MLASLKYAPMALLLASPALADCHIAPYRFKANGDTVNTSTLMSAGDTCFHTMRTNNRMQSTFTAIEVAEKPRHGVLTVTSNAFQYKSNRGHAGSDRYAVRVCMKGHGRGCSTIVFDATIR